MTGAVHLREDVHLHATLRAVHARVLDLETYPDWLAPAFRDFRADSEGCAFLLALPGRLEAVRLRRGGVEDRAIAFVRDGAGSWVSWHWALHAESAHEVHLTAEATYEPAPGITGALLEGAVHRPHRAQALRDALWRLKQVVERAESGR